MLNVTNLLIGIDLKL